MANPLDDTPPGAPAYASGPLAVQRPPTAGAVLATGLSPDSYFNAQGQAKGGVPVVQPTGVTGSGIGQIASNLLNRAATGLSNLFGGSTSQPSPVTTPAATGVTTIADRTNSLEGGLNALQLRSTGFRPAASNVAVASNSAADVANAAFAGRQGPTPAEYNALPPAQRKALDNFKSLPAAQQETQPNFYQTMIAQGQK